MREVLYKFLNVSSPPSQLPSSPCLSPSRVVQFGCGNPVNIRCIVIGSATMLLPEQTYMIYSDHGFSIFDFLLGWLLLGFS